MSRIEELYQAGQSVWYDNIQRRLLVNGELSGMIERGEIRGVTSNPTIFMNAITKSDDYDAALVPLAKAGKTAEEILSMCISTCELELEGVKSFADAFTALLDAVEARRLKALS